MKRLLSITLVIAAGLLSVLGAVPAPESLLANDTLLVLTIPDYTKAHATWAQGPTFRLWDDPAVKPFRDKFTAKLKSEYIEPLEKELGIKFGDYTDLAQGQVTFAITQGDWDGSSPGKRPGFMLLVDTKDKSDQLKSKLADIRKKWIDSGKKLRTDKIRDVEFTTLLFQSDELAKTFEKAAPKKPKDNADDANAEKPAPPQKVELLVGQSGSLLVLCNSARDVEKILIRQSGGGVPSLGEQAAFASNAKMFRDASTYAWVNLKPIIANLQKSIPSGPNQGPMPFSPAKVISALGFSELQTLALSLGNSPDGVHVDMQLNVPEANRKGLFKILSYEAKEAGPLPFIPTDAVKFTRWRLDMQKAWNSIENMLGDINPQLAGGIKMMVDLAGKDKDPNFDLRKSLIANLGDDMISFQKAPRGQTFAELSSPPALFMISSPRAETLASSIRSITAFLPQSSKVKEREFLGRKVYAMNVPSSPAGGQGDAKPKVLSYAASGGYVVFSTDVATLEEYLRGDVANSLKDVPGLADAAQKVGGLSTGLFGYENQAETMRATIETLKKDSGTLSALLKGPLGGSSTNDNSGSTFKDWVDFGLLPSFDRIAKYFYFSVWAGSVNADGLSLKVFAPTPPQLKK
jgi:Protein of unknown function (DUF3352)